MSVNAKKPNNYFAIKQHQQLIRTLSPTLLRRAAWWTMAFVVFSVLVGLRVTRGMDEWILTTSQSFGTDWLDLGSSFISLLGDPEITGMVTLWLAFWGWRARGIRGLAALLLFVGVAVELVMKYAVPHAGPPTLWQHRHLPSLIHLSTPYSFPSGHMVRTAFLAVYITSFFPRWRRVGWGFVVLMALTRIYLNEHWTSDVIGGSLLGLTFALVAVAIDPLASRGRAPESTTVKRAAL